MRRVAIADAKNKLTSLIHDVENGTKIELTRHGHPVAVLLSIGDFALVRGGRSGFSAACLSFRQKYRAGLLSESDWDANALRDKTPGRSPRAF
jgi:prevent-host-death family protein